MYKIISFIFFLAFMYFFFNVLLLINFENSLHPTLIIVLLTFPLMLVFLNLGASLDNRVLKRKIVSTRKVRVTHRGTEESIQEKLNNKLLPAHDVLASSPLQRLLGARLLRLIDHDKPVVWVHIGMPNDVKDRKLGLTKSHNYTSAISFDISSQKLEFPKGVIKQLYGQHQCVIESDVRIPVNYILSRKNEHGNWV